MEKSIKMGEIMQDGKHVYLVSPDGNVINCGRAGHESLQNAVYLHSGDKLMTRHTVKNSEGKYVY